MLRNPEIQLEIILRATDDQDRKYCAPEEEDWFLWPEKDNRAQRLANKQHDSQTTGAKGIKSVFNELFLPDSISTIGYKSSTLKNSSVSANFDRIIEPTQPTQDKMHSQKYL